LAPTCRLIALRKGITQRLQEMKIIITVKKKIIKYSMGKRAITDSPATTV